MATVDVTGLLLDNPPADEFTPYCQLSEDADALTVYFKGDPDYSRRLTDHVTLFLSLDSGEIVGCRIKGIAEIMTDLPNYIVANHGGVQLSLIFLPLRGAANDEFTRRTLNELAKAAMDQDMLLECVGGK